VKIIPVLQFKVEMLSHCIYAAFFFLLMYLLAYELTLHGHHNKVKEYIKTCANIKLNVINQPTSLLLKLNDDLPDYNL